VRERIEYWNERRKELGQEDPSTASRSPSPANAGEDR